MSIESNITPARPVQSQAAHLPAGGGLKGHSLRVRRIRLFIFGFLAVFLVWEVVTRSVAAYLADANPELALRLQSSNPTALLNLTESELTSQQSEQADSADAERLENNVSSPTKEMLRPDTTQPDAARPTSVAAPSASEMRAWAKRALINDPLNARAFSLLGQLSKQVSDKKRTKLFMEASVGRSLHEASAVYWMMVNSYEEENFRAALHYADTLLRTRPQEVRYVMPVLGKIAEVDRGGGALKELLATNPPWRSAFFFHFPANITDARTPLHFFLDLKNTPDPPAASDLRNYLSFLINHKFYDLAYYTWLQFLPEAQLSSTGHLFNGSFEMPSSGLPFDWNFTETSGARTSIAARPEGTGEHALFLEFGPGRVDFRGITQMILLAPGRYQFRGRLKLDIVSQRGLKWEIRCVDGRLIGDSPRGNGSQREWKEFKFFFTVPSSDCPAQGVKLTFDARSASERFISGSAWYDDLRIARETVEPEPEHDASGSSPDPSRPN